MARDLVTGRNLVQLRRLLKTGRRCVGAARGEPAARLGVNGGGKLPFEKNAVFCCVGNRDGDGGQKRLGLRVAGVVEQLFCCTFFYHFAQVHHADLVRDMLDYGKIMRNEQICQTHFLL